MKILLLLLLGIIGHTESISQNLTSATIKAGGTVRDVLTPADIFYYSQFIKGKVVFQDGTKSEARLNYSCLVDEMHFIDAKGDTLALANEKIVKFILIGQDTFYYNEGYVRQVASNNIVKLADKRVWKVGSAERIGAYDNANPSGAITTLTSYNDGEGRRYNLVVNEDIDLRIVNQLYFGDAYNHFVLASKKNLMMLFPKRQRTIENYLKEKKVDFTSKEDLEKIINFLGDL